MFRISNLLKKSGSNKKIILYGALDKQILKRIKPNVYKCSFIHIYKSTYEYITQADKIGGQKSCFRSVSGYVCIFSGISGFRDILTSKCQKSRAIWGYIRWGKIFSIHFWLRYQAVRLFRFQIPFRSDGSDFSFSRYTKFNPRCFIFQQDNSIYQIYQNVDPLLFSTKSVSNRV